VQVPLLDLKAQYSSIKTDIESAIAEVLQSQRFILGPKVEECEEAIALYCGCPHAIGKRCFISMPDGREHWPRR